MKKTIYWVIGLLVLGIVVYLILPKSAPSFGSTYNLLSGTPTHGATTTQDALPLKVLSRNDARQYVRITNNSDTVMYLWLRNFDNAAAASTTIDINKGIRLNTVGTVDSVYEIGLDNLWKGDIWATTTAVSKTLIYFEK